MAAGAAEPATSSALSAHTVARWAWLRHGLPRGLATARAQNDLAVLLKARGGFEEAATLYRRAHATLVAKRGPDHRTVATALHNLGGLAHAAERPAAGEGPAREALAIREAALGPDHPDVAADAAALAGILEATGRFEEAAALLLRALSIFKRQLSPEHYEVGVTLGTLGTIDARQGDLPRAEQRLRRALRTKESTLGTDHPELVPTLGTLAVVCRRRGRHAEAESLTNRALGLLERHGMTTHPHHDVLASNLATIDATRPRARPPALTCALRDEQHLGIGRDAVLDSLDVERTVEGRRGGSANRMASVGPGGTVTQLLCCATVPRRGDAGSASGGRGIRCRLRGGLSVTRR